MYRRKWKSSAFPVGGEGNPIPPPPTAQGSYPDLPVSAIAQSISAPGSAYAPPVSNITVSASAPAIAEYTRQGSAGDVQLISGEQLTTSNYVVFAGDSTASATALFADGQQGGLTLPANLPPGMALLWPTGTETGTPVRINGTELWWVGNSRLTPGETFSLYGQNLSITGGVCHAYIDGHGWIESIAANPYKADFVCPTLTPGTHTIYAHNGHGEKYGWSQPSTFEVWAGTQFNDDTNTWINAGSYLVGDGITDNNTAMQALAELARQSGDWPTIYFPDGIYRVEAPDPAVTVRFRYFVGGCRIIGESRNAVLLSGDSGVNGYVFRFESSNFHIENMTLAYTTENYEPYRPAYYFGKGNQVIDMSGVTLTNCAITAEYATSKRTPLQILQCEHVKIKNCDISVSKGWSNVGLYDLEVANCTFKGMWDSGVLLGVGGVGLSVHNTTFANFNMADTTSAKGWWQGRAIGLSANASANVYLGDNQTIDGRARDGYDPFFLAQPTSISAATYTHTDTSGYKWYDVTFTVPTPLPIEGFASQPDGTINITITQGDGTHRVNNLSWVVRSDYDLAAGTFTANIREGQLPHNDTLLTAPNNNCILKMVQTHHANAGEQVMKEGGSTMYRRAVLSSTASTVTLENTPTTGIVYYDAQVLSIVKGTGLGQTRRLIADNGTGTYTLDEPWLIQPDTTSVATLGKSLYKTAIYNNSFDGRDGGAAGTASAGVQVSRAGTAQLYIDSNTFTEIGVVLSHEHRVFSDTDQLENLIVPRYHTLIKNNIMTDQRIAWNHALQLTTSALELWFEEPWIGTGQPGSNLSDLQHCGMVFRNNSGTNYSETVINFGSTPFDFASQSAVFQDNTFVNLSASYTNAAPDYANLYFIDNTP